MHNKKIMLAVALALTMQIQAKHSWPGMDFDEIIAFFNQQFEQFDHHVRSMHSQRKQPMQALAIPAITAKATIPLQTLKASIKETDTQVLIEINGIDTQEIDARLNDDNTRLVLSTPHEKIEIQVQDNYIQVQTCQQRTNQQTNNKGQFFGASACTVGQDVSGDPILGNQIIEYDPSTLQLTVALAKQEIVKQGKSVPITIKQK